MSDLAHQGQQLAEGIHPLRTIFTYPDQCRFICSASLNMPIKAVDRNVEFSVDKPTGRRPLTFQHTRPWLCPAEPSGDLLPESFQVPCCLVIQCLVVFDVGCRQDFRLRGKTLFFCEKLPEIALLTSTRGAVAPASSLLFIVSCHHRYSCSDFRSQLLSSSGRLLDDQFIDFSIGRRDIKLGQVGEFGYLLPVVATGLACLERGFRFPQSEQD